MTFRSMVKCVLSAKCFFLGQEEVLGVASSSDDEERVRPRGKKAKKNKKPFVSEPLPAVDSDLEEDRQEEEEEQYTSQWGKKRSAYYNADYVHEEWKGLLFSTV